VTAAQRIADEEARSRRITRTKVRSAAAECQRPVRTRANSLEGHEADPARVVIARLASRSAVLDGR